MAINICCTLSNRACFRFSITITIESFLSGSMKVDCVTGMFFFAFLTLLTAVEADTCNCDKTKNGTFLVCSTVTKNVTEAHDYCLNNCNSTLASIKSELEFKELEDFIGRVKNCIRRGGRSQKAFYIGAQDRRMEGEWRWIDDNTLLNETYSNWNKPSQRKNTSTCLDQPDEQNVCNDENPVSQDYAVMQMCDGSASYGAWFDVIGNSTRPFICKIRQVTVSRENLFIPIGNGRNELSAEGSMAIPTRIEYTNLTVTQAEHSPSGTSLSSVQNQHNQATNTTIPSSSSAILSTTSEAVTTAYHVSMPVDSSTATPTSTTSTKAMLPAKVTQTHPATPFGSTETLISGIDEDYLKQLHCMILKMLKQSNQRDKLIRDNDCELPNQGDDWNPILHFENNVSRKAAEIFFRKKLNKPYSKKVDGIRLDIVPIKSKAASGETVESVELPMETSCIECDKLDIDHSNMHEFDTVIVGARFERSVLEGLRIYDASLETTKEDERSNPVYFSYVSPKTSVLSVTLFRDTLVNGALAVSKPTKIKFNIGNDDSLKQDILRGRRSRLSKLARKCVFMKDNGKWSDRGCTASNDVAVSSVQCDCNHTTAFAVMVSLSAVEIPDWLETILLIAEIIGVIFLILTLAMLLYLKQTLKKGRIITQLHLCLALLLMHISMLCANYATPIDGLCVTLTAFSHFFMVSSAMWMLNEGIVLYKKTGSGALNFDIYKILKWLIFLGWVLPLLYAGICLAIGMGLGVYLDTTIEYDDLKSRNLLENTTIYINKYQMCWLGTKNSMVVAAIAPVAITLLLATCILMWVSKVIWGMTKDALDMMPSAVKKNHQSLKSTARAIAILMPVLGLPWMLAFMVNIRGAEVVFTAINGIINGLQGLVLFIIYIIINRETRTSMKRKLSRSFSSTNTHSLSTIPSSTSRKSRDSATRKFKGEEDKRSTLPESSKEDAALPKV